MLAFWARNWWMVALRGLAAIIFGVMALVWPGITLTVLVLLFVAYVMMDGIFTIVTVISERAKYERWWVMLLQGLLGIVAGVVAFVWPGITTLVLLYLIAAWAVVIGIWTVVAAIQLRKEMEGEWLLILSGILSVLFGLILIVRPGAGAVAIAWFIGAYAIVLGVLLIIFAFRLRELDKEIQSVLEQPA